MNSGRGRENESASVGVEEEGLGDVVLTCYPFPKRR